MMLGIAAVSTTSEVTFAWETGPGCGRTETVSGPRILIDPATGQRLRRQSAAADAAPKYYEMIFERER